MALDKSCELLEHPKAESATTWLAMTSVKAQKEIQIEQWAISSQASWKQDEGSTTRKSNLSLFDMVKFPRAQDFACKIDKLGDIIRPTFKIGGHIMQGRRIIDVVFSKEELAESYERLGSLNRVAREYGVSKKCILNYMKKLKIQRNARPRPPIQQVAELAGYGMGSSEIGLKLGFTQTYIGMIAKENDIMVQDDYHKGFSVTESGYILVRKPQHPNADTRGYVRLHRLIMEQYLGRFLDFGEVVHHVDEDKTNNRIENLELMLVGTHISLHHTGKKGRGPDKKPRKNARKKDMV